MSWGAKLRSALHGTIDGSDVAALLAASRPLATLRQQLDGRRLDLELAQAQTSGSASSTAMEWRSRYDLGEIAAPLWLAEELVALAQHLYDAEMAASPDAPGTMSVVAHERALALLQPVASIIIELSAALVDPTRRSSLPLPVSVARQDNGTSARAIPASYVRGLLGGAEQVEGVVQVAVADVAKLAAGEGVPPWLGAAVQRLRGEMATAQTRLEMVRARSAPLLNHQALDDTTMQQIAADLWLVIDTYVRIGQMIAAPRLLPGASATPPPDSQRASARPAQAPSPAQPQSVRPGNPMPATPPPPVAPSRTMNMPPAQPVPPPVAPHAIATPVERDRQIPQIVPTWHAESGSAAAQSLRQPPVEPPDAAVHDHAIPQIGTPITTSSSSAQKTGRQIPQDATDQAHSMPEIGPRVTGQQPPTSSHNVRELPQIGVPSPPPVPDTRGQDTSARQTARPLPAANHRQPNDAPPAADRRIGRADRWLLTASETRHHLRASGQEERAERELSAFWEAKNWTLTVREQAYRDRVAALMATGAVVTSGQHLRVCPWPSIYRVADRAVQLDGQTLLPGSFFTFEHCAGQQSLRTALTAQDGIADV